MKFVDYFSHIYVINLPSRKDRYRRIIWQLKEAGIWNTDKVSIFKAIKSRTALLSHLAVLKLAREARLDNVLVIEDDLVISNLFRANEENLVSQLNGRKWDFVFVDGPQERSREVKVAMKVSSKYIFLHDPNFGEQSFFPNEEWVKVGNSDKLFEKVQKCF